MSSEQLAPEVRDCLATEPCDVCRLLLQKLGVQVMA